VVTVSSKQREDVDKRVQYTALTNAKTATPLGGAVNVYAAIHLAFVLGIRMGIAHPNLAGDYMHRWIADHVERIGTGIEPTTVGQRHEQAIHAIAFPLMWTPEEWQELEGQEE